ncbi:MAG TPA: methyltransferase [Clostridiales bacterium]|nr:methyltransferase [Clostridiales bacterium]
MKPFWTCPKCRALLTFSEKTAHCAAGHSYDLAKEGYINLLLSAGGIHGDSREMVEARRRFLESGAYEPLRRAVAELVCRYLPAGGICLDAGCGEGYYTEDIAEALAGDGKDALLFAFDISRDAARRTAKRRRDLSVAVASAYAIPARDGSADLLTDLFSPMATAEFARVLKPQGIFLLVIPEKEHLFGLKEALYDTPYKNEVAGTDLDGFTLLESREIRYPLTLDGKERIADLFLMTPYAYRTSPKDKEKLAARDTLVTEVHFRILIYQKGDCQEGVGVI